MPVVARSIPIQGGFRSVSLPPRILLMIVALTVARSAIAQDSSTPASQESSTPATQESTPLPEANPDEKVPPVEVPPEVPAAAAVGEGCLQEILEQQKQTRTLRDLRNPLARPTKEEVDKLKRDYDRLLKKGFGVAEVKKVQDVLAYRILKATDGDFVLNPANMQGLLQDVENDITKCGIEIGNASNQRTARKNYCTEVLAVTKQLLENNLDSRIAAVNIMRMLYEVNPPVNVGKATLLNESLTALLAVMADPLQPDSVKVATANSLRNVLRNCDVVEQDQFRICDAIGKQLERPCCESAYQMVLLDVLFHITKPRRTVGDPEPTALLHFAAVLNDESRPIEVRCHAAVGIGRAAYDPLKTNFDPLAWKIAKLTLETGVSFSQANDGHPKWPICGADLWFAFRPFEKAETDKGLMNRAAKSALVAGAAELVQKTAPVILLNGGDVPIDDLKAIRTFLDANKPTNMKWDPNAPPLDY